MTKHSSFAQESFDKKLRKAEELEHDYYRHMERYFPLPNFEQLVLKNLSRDFGKNDTWDLLPYIAADYQDDAYADYPEDNGAPDQDDALPDDLPWDDGMPQADPELLKQEENFKQLCNLAGAYTASVTISLCNVCGLIAHEVPPVQLLSGLNLAARAQMNASSAITALFPQMNFIEATVYARKSTKDLACVMDIINQVGELLPGKKIAMSPLKLTIQKALDATANLATESDKMSDNPNLPF